MTISLDQLSDPTVRAFIGAINSNDRQAFFKLLTEDATMSDDGSDRDLNAWVDREIFTSNGRMAVEQESKDGRKLVARFTNETWGEMRTRWQFEITGGRISRFDTGQA